MIYLLVGHEFLKTYLLGGFSKKEDAENYLDLLNKRIKEAFTISFVEFEIIEVPFNSTAAIDEMITFLPN